MFEYIVGKINYLNSTYLVLENNFLGYKIYVSDPNKFEINKIQKVYLYIKVFQNTKNYLNYEYYGFKSLVEKIFFETLLSINGIGVKIALNILKNDLNLIKQLIRKQDVNTLASLEGLNAKLATNIISQLSYKMNLEKINDDEKNLESNLVADIISALKALGYKKQEIEYAINKMSGQIDNSKEASDLISCAIKLILENETISN